MYYNHISGGTQQQMEREWYLGLVETGLIPDRLLRIGIRRLLKKDLRQSRSMGVEEYGAYCREKVEQFSQGPIAVKTEKANEQHYEVPPEFFLSALGPRMKYSAGCWPSPKTSLAESEEAMLELTCRRGEIEDGMKLLDLGCGWGAFSLYAAETYPKADILAVSGSKDQARYIEGEIERRGLSNLRVITSDINDFAPDEKFDRVVSVEMFEHMKNYRELMRRISQWLNPKGKLFVHIFSHREFCYEYTKGWMARTFFSGGTMPSDHLLLYFQEHLTLRQHWRINGNHYRRTLRAWLDRLDAHRKTVEPILKETYGPREAARWRIYWRLFFMACEETFALGGGNEYIVSHYLFDRAS